MVSMPVLCLHLATFLFTVNGYVLERWPEETLLPFRDEADAVHLPVRRSAPEPDYLPQTGQGGYTKKSQALAYKALKKFGGSGSRNCFFTPIQCMIQHDMSKYKNLVGGSRSGGQS